MDNPFEEYDYLCNPENLRNRLLSLSHNNSALEILSKRCYRHRNGFDKIVLKYWGKALPSIRLHIWWGDQDNEHGLDIHNHPWKFSSKVITGEIVNQIYEVSTTPGEIYHHYKILQNKESNSAYVEYVGLSSLKIKAVQKIMLGKSYSLASDELHITYPTLAEITSTLILQGEFQRYCKLPLF